VSIGSFLGCGSHGTATGCWALPTCLLFWRRGPKVSGWVGVKVTISWEREVLQSGKKKSLACLVPEDEGLIRLMKAKRSNKYLAVTRK